MIALRIEGHTHELGAPKDWDEAANGPCAMLAIRAERHGAQCWMVSAWEPTPAELLALAAGAKVYLQVAGTLHPAVGLVVGTPDRETPALSMRSRA